MSILDRIKGNPFEKLSRDELLAEKIKLERDEKLKMAEVETLSSEKKDLFERGFKVSESERRALARQMQQRDRKIKQLDVHLKRISDSIRVVDNLMFIQDNKRMLEQAGLMSKVLRMPKSKLEELLAKVNIADQMRTGKIDSILRTMDAEYSLTGEVVDDKETRELLELWRTGDAAKADELYEELEKEKAGAEKREIETA